MLLSRQKLYYPRDPSGQNRGRDRWMLALAFASALNVPLSASLRQSGVVLSGWGTLLRLGGPHRSHLLTSLLFLKRSEVTHGCLQRFVPQLLLKRRDVHSSLEAHRRVGGPKLVQIGSFAFLQP